MFINVVLMVFNLLPIPPLDGFGIITAIFNLERWQYFEEFYRSGLFIILILIITGGRGAHRRAEVGDVLQRDDSGVLTDQDDNLTQTHPPLVQGTARVQVQFVVHVLQAVVGDPPAREPQC